MRKMIDKAKSSKGATLVEYAVMLAVILVVAITAVKAVGTTTNTKMGEVGTALGASAS